MRSNAVKTCILSAENLINSYAYADLLAPALDLFNVRIVAYVRRQDQWLNSAWQQWYLKVFATFEELLDDRAAELCNWDALLSGWERVFGRERIIVRPFLRPLLFRYDIVYDFYKATGLLPPHTPLQKEGRNMSFDEALGALANRNRSLFKDEHDNRFFEVYAELLGRAVYNFEQTSWTMTTERQRRIFDRYEAGNRRLADRYLEPSDAAQLFAPPAGVTPPTELDQLRHENALLARALFALGDRVLRHDASHPPAADIAPPSLQPQSNSEVPRCADAASSVGKNNAPAGAPQLSRFNPDWYAWQNPQWNAVHATPFEHYMASGRFNNADPSPMIDMKRFGDMVGAAIAPENRLEAIEHGLHSVSLGVYNSWADLDSVQRDFISAIAVTAGRDERRLNRRYLVLLQAGPQSTHRRWFRQNRERTWDLLVNYYDSRGFDESLGDVSFFQAGTKFTSVYNFVTRFPNLLEQYEYVLLLDDDIMVTMDGLDALFATCARNDLDLAQMALSDQSTCIWDCIFARGRTGLRRLNCVEIMMPVLSRRALRTCGHDFRRSVSGFGLDLLLGKKLAKADYSNIAIVDDIVVDHTKPIDDTGGGYYTYLRSRLINPKAELWRLIEQFGLDRSIREINAPTTSAGSSAAS
jgi:hypothetical protein